MRLPGRTAGLGSLFTEVGLARLVTWTFVLLMGSNAIFEARSTVEATCAVAGLVLFLAWEAGQQRIGHRAAVGIGAALVLGGLGTHCHFAFWLGLPVLLLALGLRRGLAVTVLALGAFAWAWSGSTTAPALAILLLGLVMNILLIYLFQSIAVTARTLHEARGDLATTEVDAERNRLAAELNTLIGQTLQQVAVRAEAARAGLATEEKAAHAQLDDVEALITRGLDQLRLLTFEPVIDEVETEIRTAETLCRRLGVRFVPSADDVDDAVNPTFALLLRESVTNMFKHADPTRCTMVLRQDAEVALFSFTNDGAPCARTGACPGTGQRRWRAAIEGLGGTLEAGPMSGDRYRVVARVPVASFDHPSTGAARALQRSSRG
ncbi:histidine kinase [Luteipulveratus sp. YIM 133132]|uniref:sensor histidine kinase n=1 Tax=Luteipulveratus flavus TaxID=3031728 RepID=UPI0023AE7133|nr:histidine kinase [Luteipulveratus sp. YIM 133132]MDE9364924.1 histidine kinase [Luteipulveratus sp. YIM 133132]